MHLVKLWIKAASLTCGIMLTGAIAMAEKGDATGGCDSGIAAEGPCDAVGKTALRMNDIQSVGSHNSYKLAIPEVELAMIRSNTKEAALGLDYGHIPLSEQLDLGMRQIELDIFNDPKGGRYSNPLLPALAANTPGAVPFDASSMAKPGFKVMHIQDIDVRSTCALFVQCLAEIKSWSKAHPGHVPILILLNAKDEQLNFPGSTKALAFDRAAFDALDKEILSVFDADHIITPDIVRGPSKTLRDAVTRSGWPKLNASRGKILFALDDNAAKVEVYLRDKPSLEGLPMFVNAINPAAAHAAYFTMNDPVKDGALIQERVKKGFLVRTRADADTREARLNDTSRRVAAFVSGAQYISTDYYKPRSEWSDYQVGLQDGLAANCNPVRIDCIPQNRP